MFECWNIWISRLAFSSTAWILMDILLRFAFFTKAGGHTMRWENSPRHSCLTGLTAKWEEGNDWDDTSHPCEIHADFRLPKFINIPRSSKNKCLFPSICFVMLNLNDSDFWSSACQVWFRADFFPVNTLLETNISHTKAFLKMIFLFPRWDMLVPCKIRTFVRSSCFWLPLYIRVFEG